MSTVAYDLEDMAVDRKRTPRNLTLNPVLVKRLIARGALDGEENLSRLVDRCIEVYLAQHPMPHAAKRPPKK